MAVYTDNFNRADAGTLGANWTNFGSGGFSVVSNNARPTPGGGNMMALWSANTLTNDQYSQVIVAIPSDHSGPICRATPGTGDGTFYLMFMPADSGNGTLYKVVAGTYTAVNSTLGFHTAGDTLKISAVGGATTVVTCYVNGATVGSYSDSSSPILSGSAGMYGGQFAAWLDNFECGDIAAGGTNWGRMLGQQLNRIVQS